MPHGSTVRKVSDLDAPLGMPGKILKRGFRATKIFTCMIFLQQSEPNQMCRYTFLSFSGPSRLGPITARGVQGSQAAAKLYIVHVYFPGTTIQAGLVQHWPMTFGNNGLQCSLSSHRFSV